MMGQRLFVSKRPPVPTRRVEADMNMKFCFSTSLGWWSGTIVIFPYFGNNHPNWLIFFGGLKPPTSIYIYVCVSMCYYLLLGKSSTVSLLGLPHYINAHCDFRPSFTWEFGAKVDFLPGSWEVQQLDWEGPCDLLDTAHLWEPRWVRKAKVEYIWVHIYIYTYWYDLIYIYIYTRLYQSCWWYKSNEKCCKQINIYQPSRAGAGTLWFSHQGDPIETSLATSGDGDEWDGAWDPIDVPEPWRKTMGFSPWGNWSAWLRPYRWTAGYQQLFLARKKICFSQMIQIQSNK